MRDHSMAEAATTARCRLCLRRFLRGSRRDPADRSICARCGDLNAAFRRATPAGGAAKEARRASFSLSQVSL